MIFIKIDGSDQFLFQWDKGQRLMVIGAEENHCAEFAFVGDDRSAPAELYEENGVMYCDIPDAMLTRFGQLVCYIRKVISDQEETIKFAKFTVRQMPMPNEYVAPDEILIWRTLEKRIDELEARDSGGLTTMVVRRDYTTQDTSAGTVKANYSVAEINAHYDNGGVVIFDGTTFKASLQMISPDKAVFGTGAILVGTKYRAHTITIDADGYVTQDPYNLGNEIDSKITAPVSAEIGQTIVVKSVDENGKPIEWEAIDFPTNATGGSYTLPTASTNVLGGVKADPVTEGDTQPVRIGEDGKLYTAPTEQQLETDLSGYATESYVNNAVSQKTQVQIITWEADD